MKEWKNNKWLYGTLGAYIAFLIPMVVVCFYTFPAADDFVHGSAFRLALSGKESIAEYLGAVWSLGTRVYTETQGQYTINYLIYLNPAILNYHLYPIACLMNLALFLGAHMVLAHTVSNYILKADYKLTLWLWMAASFLTMQFAAPSELFYWYAGFVAYTAPFSLFLLAVAMFIRIYCNAKNRSLFIALSAPFGFLLAGTHYPLVLFVFSLTVVSLLVCILFKKKQGWFFLPFMTLFCIGFALSVMAPGNKLRAMGAYLGSTNLPKTIFAALEGAAGIFLNSFTETPILLFFFLLLPLLLPRLKTMVFPFKWPGLVTGIGVLLVAATIVPIYYVLGETDYPLEPRYEGFVHMICMCIWLGLLLYWAGWLVKKDKAGELKKSMSNVAAFALAICLALAFPLIAQSQNNALFKLSSVLAVEDLVYGELRDYHRQVKEKFSTLESAQTDTVALYNDLVTTRTQKHIGLYPDTWQLKALAGYFNKTIEIR